MARILGLLFLLGSCCFFLAGQSSKPAASPAPSNEAPNAKVVTSAAVPPGKIQTFSGKISDVNCGPRHYMLANATDAECTRACFARRGLYALVVGDKVYSLVNDPGAALNELAGQQARIKAC